MPPSAPAPTPAPNILILTASVGAGHSRAAQAVDLALRRLSPAAHIQTLDILTLATPVFRRIYSNLYLDFVSKAPNLAGAFYAFTDKPASPTSPADRFRILVERANLRPLTRLIRSGPSAPARGPWDLILHTHFLPAELTARLRRKGLINTPHATVVTDLDAHGAWVNSPTDRYFTASPEAGIALESRGVSPSTITLTGIPIHPAFYDPITREAARAALSLPDDRPVVLLLAGGAGTGPVERYFQAALAVRRPAHFIVVCGRSAPLKARVEAFNTPSHLGPHRATILGFTDRIHDYYAAADIVITKPGGLTTSEILACGSAMAIINPIPGQESRNSDHLLELGAAVKIHSPETLPHKLSALLEDPPRLAALRATAKKHARPTAALDIVRHALAMINHPAAPAPLA